MTTSRDVCYGWLKTTGPDWRHVGCLDLGVAHTHCLVYRLLRLLPEEYQAEYAGALHLKVSGEWSIHPATAFATLTADPEVMLQVLADLISAHPECRPVAPAARTKPAATASQA